MTRRLLAVAVAFTCLAVAACSDKGTQPKSAGTPDPTIVDPGAALFERAEYRKVHAAARAADPIAVPMASVVILRKADVPSRVDGTVLWVGVEADQAAADKLGATEKYTHPREPKVYRRLQPGDFVKRGQLIALLDDEHSFIDYQSALTKETVAKESAKAYKVTVTKLGQIVTKTADGVRRNIVPEQELLNSQATQARYEAEQVEHEGSAQVAAADAQKAKYVLDRHSLRAPIDGQVQQILKHEGEGVKGQEPVLVIHDFGRLRAIGHLPKEYVNAVSPGDEVTIEVPRDVPHGDTFIQHTTNKPITVVTVAVVGGKPIIVSAGEDGWVYAWDRELNPHAQLRQPVGVRSLTATRPGRRSPCC